MIFGHGPCLLCVKANISGNLHQVRSCFESGHDRTPMRSNLSRKVASRIYYRPEMSRRRATASAEYVGFIVDCQRARAHMQRALRLRTRHDGCHARNRAMNRIGYRGFEISCKCAAIATANGPSAVARSNPRLKCQSRDSDHRCQKPTPRMPRWPALVMSRHGRRCSAPLPKSQMTNELVSDW